MRYKTFGIFLLLTVGILFIFVVPDQQSDKHIPYNILFISIDDMRPNIGAYGDSIAVTPNIDQLAKEGILFKRAFVQQSVCAPSRASMMTGLRPDQIKVWDLRTHFRENVPEVVTLPQFFKNNGYHTREVGKIYHDPAHAKDPQSWSGPSKFHITENLPGHKYVLPHNLEDLSGWKASATEMVEVSDSAYIDGKVAEAATHMLQEVKDSTFFLAVGFRRPHLPFSAPAKYWNLYDREEIPLPETSEPPDNAPSLALHNWTELRVYTDIPVLGDLSEQKIRELRHGYYASISYIDSQTGRLTRELERLGLKENTIIVLWSDHGFHLGEHDLWTKTTNYELDTRIPFIINVPGQNTDESEVQAIVESVDIYPTLVDLAGLSIPENLAGRSLKQFIENPDLNWEKPAISQFPRPWKYEKEPEIMGYSIRTNRYRYIQWNEFFTGKIVARELYNHKIDPLETKNIASDKNNEEIMEELKQKLHRSYSNNFVKGFDNK